MDERYWHSKWDTDDVAFHQAQFNRQMVQHFPGLEVPKGAVVFVPLCGKTRDMAWLLQQGYEVSGVELSERAVVALFEDLGVTPEIEMRGALRVFRAERLTIWVGDIFALAAEDLGEIAAVYDRAALVALPDEMRARYVAHLMQIAAGAPQFLLTFAYDQTQMQGPPFSITASQVREYYDAHYTVTQVGSFEIPSPGLKGRVAAVELAFVLAERA